MRILGTLAILFILTHSCATSPNTGNSLADEYYNLGNEWFELKKFDRAAQAYQKALSWNSSLKIASLNLARTKAELGDVTGALDLLAPIAQSDPTNLIVSQYQAWLTAKKDGIAAAADLYGALAKKLPGDISTQFNAGLSLTAAGKEEAALAAWKAWKALDGKGWTGLAAWAAALENAGAPETADAWLEAASAFPESDPKRFLPLANRAKVLEKAELFGDAVQSWADAIALPVAPDQARGEAQFRRGSLLLLQIEDYQQGSLALIEAWKLGFKDVEAWKAVRENPRLKFGVRLQADLKLAGVTP